MSEEESREPQKSFRQPVIMVIPARHKPLVRKGCYGIIVVAAVLCVLLLLRGMMMPMDDSACCSNAGLPLELQQMRTKYYI